MKKILLLIFLISSITTKAQWSRTSGPENCYVSCIARTPSGILCGTYGGIYFSPDEGLTWQEFSQFQSKFIHSILANSDTFIVTFSSGDVEYDYYDSAFCSTSFDGGQTWTIPTFFSSYGFAACNLHYYYGTLIIDGTEDLFISHDYGLTFNVINIPHGYYCQSKFYKKYFLIIACDQNYNYSHYYVDSIDGTNPTYFDPQHHLISVAMVDSVIFGYKISTLPGYYDIVKSIDFGQNWNVVTTVNTFTNFIFDAIDSTLFYTDSIYQYHVSSDYGATWSLAPKPHKLDYFFSIPLLNGDEMSYHSGELVHYIPSLDSSYNTANGIRGSAISLITSDAGNLYCVDGSKLYKSTDAGATWQLISSYPFLGGNNLIVNGDTLFTAEFDLQRSYDGGHSWSTPSQGTVNIFSVARRSNRLYACGGDLYYSDDFGDHWNSLPPLPTNSPCGIYNLANTICVHNNLLFVATDDGIYRLDSTDSYWTYCFCYPIDEFANNNSPNIYSVENKIIFACDSALFISDDMGVTWTFPALNGIPLDVMGEKKAPKSFVGANGDIIGTCGRYGILYSYNNGNDWFQLSPPLTPFVPSGLIIMNHQLFSGSKFQAVWTTNTVLNIPTDANKNNLPVKIYPNPANQNFYIDLGPQNKMNYTLTMYDELGIKVLDEKHQSDIEKIYSGELANGIYFIKITYDDASNDLQLKIAISH